MYSIALNTYTQTIVVPFPPWYVNTHITICIEPPPDINKNNLANNNGILLHHLTQNYKDTLYIYTDGSKVTSPKRSTAAAYYVWQSSQVASWKLPDDSTILTAELYAIQQAIKYAIKTKMDVIILTDSRTGLTMIRGYREIKHYRGIINDIISLSNTLRDLDIKLTLQWIPGHSNISGNEMADKIAHATHNFEKTIDKPYELEEVTSKIKDVLGNHHAEKWHIRARISRYGQLFNTFFTTDCVTSCNRKIDKLLIRLRTGHIGLNEHLFKLKLSTTQFCPNCTTQLPENVEHFLLHCPSFLSARDTLHQALLLHSINTFDLNTLLGGGNYSKFQQLCIRRNLFKYILKTRQLNRLLH